MHPRADLPVLYRIRMMTVEDIPTVMEIDTLSFPNPWPENTYQYELTENIASHLLVIEEGSSGEVAGFIGYWQILDEAHISTFAIHPAWRRHGFGHAILQAMLADASAREIRLATLEVRAGNVAAQELYRGFGFKIEGRRKGYYRDNSEDALLMTAHRLPEPKRVQSET
jgi:[ribosomal protein S18]-alanine N-acetyltransferase